MRMFLGFLAITAILVLRADVPARANGVGIDPFLEDFQRKRGEVQSYSATFVQKKILTLFDETKVSTGTVFYKAPKRMLWKYDSPDKTQMLIDAESVTFYFPELEHIEKYPLEKSGAGSPSDPLVVCLDALYDAVPLLVGTEQPITQFSDPARADIARIKELAGIYAVTWTEPGL